MESEVTEIDRFSGSSYWGASLDWTTNASPPSTNKTIKTKLSTSHIEPFCLFFSLLFLLNVVFIDTPWRSPPSRSVSINGNVNQGVTAIRNSLVFYRWIKNSRYLNWRQKWKSRMGGCDLFVVCGWWPKKKHVCLTGDT